MPDTTAAPYGWRYATQADADYWSNVSLGDVLLFGRTDANGFRYIFTNYNNGPINIQGGQKIHVWRGNYSGIRIETRGDGKGFIETNSSEDNPVIITNLGGQVKFGTFGDVHDGNFWVHHFKHIFITGEYDPVLGTGHEDYPGLDGDLTQPGWIDKFGIYGDRKYVTLGGLALQLRSFLTAKVRGMACVRGFFTGFSIKSDDVSFGEYTKIDIQKCLSGWHEGEGYYLGSTNSNPDAVNANLIICKNNVALFTGAEGIQADKMTSGSEVKNNFVYKTACFYQAPFQAKFHQNCFQWTFLQGNIHAEDNIFYSGNAGGILNNTRLDRRTGLTIEESDVVLKNNLLGPSRTGIGFIQSSDDTLGLVTFYITDNVIDSITVQNTNDAYTDIDPNPDEFLTIANQTNPFYLTNNIYPSGRDLYTAYEPDVVISEAGSVQEEARPLLLHNNFGFDPEKILQFVGVWLTGEYGPNLGQFGKTGPIPYKVGDVVFMIEGGQTQYYECIQAHNVVKKPSVETAYWQKLTWNGLDEPVYTPLLQPGSYYHARGMGLNFDLTPPPPTGNGTSVTWVDKVGVTEDEFGNLEKTAPYGTTNGGAASEQVLPAGADGWVEMVAGQIDHTRTLGLSDVNTDASRTNIDYGIQLSNYTPKVQIYENDVYRGFFGNYEVGDVFRIERIGTTIYYRKNGSTIYTSTIPSTTSLIVDVALWHIGSTIADCDVSFGGGFQTGAPTWTDKVGVSEDANGTLTKTAPYGTTNAGAASIEVLPAGTDGWVEMGVEQIDHTRTLGLSDVNANESRATIDYGIQLSNYTPKVQIYENDVYRGFFGNYAIGDVFRIERIGTTIYYKKNGATFYTSPTPSTTSLIVDVTLWHVGTIISDCSISFGGGSASARMAIPELNTAEELPSIKPYPNPITSTSVLSIGLGKPADGNVEVQFIDSKGQVEWKGTMKSAAQLHLDIAPLDLSPGMKILRIIHPDGSQTVKKILKRD